MKNFSKVLLSAALVIGSIGAVAPEAKACAALGGMLQSDFLCETFTGTSMTENNRTALNYCKQNGYYSVQGYGDYTWQCKGGVSEWGPTFDLN